MFDPLKSAAVHSSTYKCTNAVDHKYGSTRKCIEGLKTNTMDVKK